ncbi:MAG TPA: HD domain-containing protein [Patescibacteria group bacterium]|nr:HD domain-containing protein [Patescibacteria group bacterium]
MDKLNQVIEIVNGLYAKKNPVIDWNKWVFEGHIKVVADWVEKISEKYDCDKESVLAAAFLHDLAYAWTSKNDPDLEEKSESKAREVLEEAGYSENQVIFIVDKIIHGHGMQEGTEPETLEAKVLATADALAHFTTDFYLVICWNRYLFEKKSLEDYKKWVLEKIERDFNNKIFFEEYKGIAKPHHQSLETLFNL